MIFVVSWCDLILSWGDSIRPCSSGGAIRIFRHSGHRRSFSVHNGLLMCFPSDSEGQGQEQIEILAKRDRECGAEDGRTAGGLGTDVEADQFHSRSVEVSRGQTYYRGIVLNV